MMANSIQREILYYIIYLDHVGGFCSGIQRLVHSTISQTSFTRKVFNLTQESKTIMQYAAKFTSLSRHAPQYIITQEDKCHKFLLGLKDQLGLALAPFEINESSVLVERTKRIKNQLNFSRQQQDSQAVKRKGFDRRPEFLGKRFKPYIRQKSDSIGQTNM